MKTLLVITVIAVLVLVFFARHRPASSPSAGDEETPSRPADWSAWQDLLDRHRIQSLSITMSDVKPTAPWQSKFGGAPYWPRGRALPTDTHGEPMHLIAQINFAEIEPKLAGYPETGLLQFFVASNDLYGAQFVSEGQSMTSYLEAPKDHAVIYHETVTHDRAALESPTDATTGAEMLPVTGEAAIHFELVDDIATPDDYRYATITQPLGEPSDQVSDYAYKVLYDASPHKISGYANFTQWDPREYYDKSGGWLLLFQMGSDNNELVDIMWGDVGIGNFFIRPDDLARLDFSRVWYSWDCH